MAQEIINLGSAPNDGNGDVLRAALQKTNNNFAELYTTIDERIDVAEKGVANGVATLGADGKIVLAQLPDNTLISVTHATSEVTQTEVVAQRGDIVIRDDANQTFIHNGGTSETMADWDQLTPLVFTTSLEGVVPAPVTSTGRFLKDDATWAELNFSDLADVADLAVEHADKIVKVNATGDALEFGPLVASFATADHTHAFNDLTDVADYMVEDAGKPIIVNATGDGLEVGEIPNFAAVDHTHAFSELTDVAEFTVADADKVLVLNETGDGVAFGVVLGTAATAATEDFATAVHTHTTADLTDVAAYGAGDIGKVYIVNPTEDGLVLGPVLGTAAEADVDDFASSADIANKRDVINIGVQVGTAYTLVDTDAGDFISLGDVTGVNLTIPDNATVEFPLGTQIYIEQSDTGPVTFLPGTGVTLNSLGGNLNTAGQFSVVMLIKTGPDAWNISGDLAV